MGRYRIVHTITYRLERPARGAQLLVRLSPQPGPLREVEHHQLIVDPQPEAARAVADDRGNPLWDVRLTTPGRRIQLTAISTVRLFAREATEEQHAALLARLREAIGGEPAAERPRARRCHARTEHALLRLREAGLPCRYLSGYALPPRGGRTLAHAWLAVELPDLGWVEHDPTSGALAERHVLLAAGEREGDVTPVAGTLDADGPYRLTSLVEVEVL